MLFESETREDDKKQVNELMARGYLKCCQFDEAMDLLKLANIEMTVEHAMIFADAMLEAGDLQGACFFYNSFHRKIPAKKLIRCGDRCLALGKVRLGRRAYALAVRGE